MSNNKVMWLAGQHIREDGLDWEVMGLFETEQLAFDACINWRQFIGPLEVNKRLPDEAIKWDGAYYPIERTADDEWEEQTK